MHARGHIMYITEHVHRRCGTIIVCTQFCVCVVGILYLCQSDTRTKSTRPTRAFATLTTCVCVCELL